VVFWWGVLFVLAGSVFVFFCVVCLLGVFVGGWCCWFGKISFASIASCVAFSFKHGHPDLYQAIFCFPQLSRSYPSVCTLFPFVTLSFADVRELSLELSKVWVSVKKSFLRRLFLC